MPHPENSCGPFKSGSSPTWGWEKRSTAWAAGRVRSRATRLLGLLRRQQPLPLLPRTRCADTNARASSASTDCARLTARIARTTLSTRACLLLPERRRMSQRAVADQELPCDGCVLSTAYPFGTRRINLELSAHRRASASRASLKEMPPDDAPPATWEDLHFGGPTNGDQNTVSSSVRLQVLRSPTAPGQTHITSRRSRRSTNLSLNQKRITLPTLANDTADPARLACHASMAKHSSAPQRLRFHLCLRK